MKICDSHCEVQSYITTCLDDKPKENGTFCRRELSIALRTLDCYRKQALILTAFIIFLVIFAATMIVSIITDKKE